MEYLQLSLTLICVSLFFLWTYKDKQERKNPEIIKVTTIDNKAYWVYNNILYTSEIVDGKVNMKKRKKIESMGISEEDIHDLLSVIGKE